jgi:hypothetical protein
VLGVVISNHGGTGGRAGAAGSPTVVRLRSQQRATSGAPATSSAPESSRTGQAAAPATGFTVCTTPPVTCSGSDAAALRTKPSEISISADGAVYIRGLTWTGWGTATATGTGTLERDNCNPNCAEGNDTAYAATVTATYLVPYGDGEQAYSSIALSVPGDPSRSETFSTGLVP